MDAEDVATAAIAGIVGLAPSGEVWIGDDAAVLGARPGKLLFATDVLVEAVHFDRRYGTLQDVGFKAMSVNVSDIAAMGGAPIGAVVAVCGSKAGDLEALYEGLQAASSAYGAPIVGGDLSDGAELVISVSLTGNVIVPPVLRSGARPGDRVYVTGPLGGAAAGLRALQDDVAARGSHVDAYRRPVARLAEGRLLGELGVSAMIDISDGLSIDLSRLVTASKVGVEITEVPVGEHASEADALYGGECYELLFAAPSELDVLGAFRRHGLEPPYEIGTVLEDRGVARVLGEALQRRGYVHRLGAS